MAAAKFLTLKEVAARLRVSDRSVFRYIHSGKLKASKIGYWRINEEDLAIFIAENANIKNSKKK
jgi:excisionase family DNA binding protein